MDGPTLTHNPTADTRAFWTLPNTLCVIRLLGSLALLPLAWLGWEGWFLGLVIAVIVSDWLDGKLAILLKQRSVYGARLDSLADVAMYGAILVSLLWLRGRVLWPEWPWLVVAIASYLVSSLAGWWKFGKWPAYHTRGAKTCWFLTSLAVVAVFAGWSIWFVRGAMVAVTLANLETLAMTFVLPTWEVDVPSIYHAVRRARSFTLQLHEGTCQESNARN